MSVLYAKNITKVYPGTIALDDVSVEFESGKVNALIGKNGSGKSTLIKIFSGAEKATKGKIYLNDALLDFTHPQQAQAMGLATVYQELSLIHGLSIAENIFMGRLPMKGNHKNGLVDWNKLYANTQKILDEYNVALSAKTKVSSLSMWQCQVVEILKAMSTAPKVLFLDEPTSSLAQQETQMLYTMIRELKKKDVIIIYISHRLQELWEICDTCTVLRDGKYIAKTQMNETTHKQLVSMMFGEMAITSEYDNHNVNKNVVLSVHNLTKKGCFENVSFEVFENEILGIAGMLGAGRTELLKSIFGAYSFDSGYVEFKNEKIEKHTPEAVKELGIAMIQEDRKHEGLVQIMSIGDNLCVAALKNISKWGFMLKEKRKQMIKKQIADLEIKIGNAKDKVSSLSGGNQQKVIVGNWLNINPTLMMFDEPSRGIDVKAKQQIFKIMHQQSQKGVSSIMVSSELEELIEVCHRILIMYHGKIVGEVYPNEISVEDLYAHSMRGDK